MAVGTQQPQTGLTFEQVWTMFQETDRLMKESRAEHDRIIKETAAQQEKTDLLVKELTKNVGGLNNSLGNMAEGLMASDLYETFEAQGFFVIQLTGDTIKIDMPKGFEPKTW
jgi:hypothetical protein